MKISNSRSLLIGAVALASIATSAVAQTAVGTVGPIEGNVVVVRGSTTQPLATGDQIFLGDRVVTRTDGVASITANGCTKSLAGAQSIVVDVEFCTKTPIALGQDAANAVNAGVSGGGIGATPAIIGLLALGGGVAAAASGGDGAPASP